MYAAVLFPVSRWLSPPSTCSHAFNCSHIRFPGGNMSLSAVCAHQQALRVRAITQVARAAIVSVLVAILFALLSLPARGQVSVLTQNADTGRDAVYSNETQLTPTSTIHKLFTMSLDDPVMG